jgi:hypothetical protein
LPAQWLPHPAIKSAHENVAGTGVNSGATSAALLSSGGAGFIGPALTYSG